MRLSGVAGTFNSVTAAYWNCSGSIIGNKCKKQKGGLRFVQENSDENSEISMKRKIKPSNFGKNNSKKSNELRSLPLEISLESSDNNDSDSESDSEDCGDGFKVPNFMEQLKPGKKVPNPFFGGKKSPILSHQNTEYSSESEPNIYLYANISFCNKWFVLS